MEIKTPQATCGMKKSKIILSSNRRDSRKPLGYEAAHSDEQWGLCRVKIVNHVRDYNRYGVIVP
jgi:hypothetical protein